MGLFSAPLRGLLRVFEEVAQQAEGDLYNEDEVKSQLMELYFAVESGKMTEEEFEEREAVLVEKLEEIEAHHAAK